jgi:hypothetical protein
LSDEYACVYDAGSPHDKNFSAKALKQIKRKPTQTFATLNKKDEEVMMPQ